MPGPSHLCLNSVARPAEFFGSTALRIENPLHFVRVFEQYDLENRKEGQQKSVKPKDRRPCQASSGRVMGSSERVKLSSGSRGRTRTNFLLDSQETKGFLQGFSRNSSLIDPTR